MEDTSECAGKSSYSVPVAKLFLWQDNLQCLFPQGEYTVVQSLSV